MIDVRGLRLSAGERVLFDELDFRIERGEFVAVLGPNGVGKTTLLRSIAGIGKPDAGSISVGSRDVRELSPGKRARLVGYIVSDDLFEDQLTVYDVVATGRYPHHRWWEWTRSDRDAEAILQALQDVNMRAFAQRSFATLSSGERQSIWIALALAQEAPLLLLDEPTSHLDVRVAQKILSLLRAQLARGKTVVTVLHDLNEAAAYADRVLLLGERTIVADGPPAAALEASLLERVYRTPMERLQTASGAVRVFPRMPA